MKSAGVIALLICAGVLASDRPTNPVAGAAQALLDSLVPDQRKKAVGAFDAADRENWHYVPRRRAGVPLKELTSAQRKLLETLLATALSKDGARKALGVITLEQVLVELGGDPEFRNPGNYYLRVFGDPKSKKPWGFRFEGHHLSLNYTSAKGAAIASTPTFFGANPHRVPRGTHAGLRILGREEDVARAFMLALDAPERKRALWTARAPREIVTGAQSRARLEKFVGIPAKALSEGQRKKLRELIELYVGNHRKATAAAFTGRVDKAGFDKVHFAWAGSTEPNKPHYYRVHGPTFVIEYVNVQNGANHSHTVLREFDRDFGRDWLAEHLRDHE